MQNIVPVVDQAIVDAGISLDQLDAIAFTSSPGLIGALLVGTGFAKSLALSLDIPLIAVHHMQAHVLSNLIADPQPEFPFLCLTVSGGHTQIVLCKDALNMEILGETLDDAAGEAFDKTAKLLGLPYPGGPLIDRYAKEGDPLKFHFPEPQIEGLNFSFSGVKTSILYFLQKQLKADPDFISKHLPDICASAQHCIVNILLQKLKKASLQTGIKTICLAGGVSANKGLRNSIKEMAEKYHWKLFIPEMEYCTDNAAMIAVTGYHKFLAGFSSPLSVSASARAEW
jgi:N6-L-threonylcarbamoyladenine synthase